MWKFYLFLSLNVISILIQANELDLVLAKYPTSIQEQLKKINVRSSIKDLIPTYEMKCDRKFCELWSRVSFCPKCCVKKCVSSTGLSDDCNGAGWCSQPFFSSLFSAPKYVELNVFELFPYVNADVYLQNRHRSSRKPKNLFFEDRHEEFTINPIEPETFEIISKNGKKQIQSRKLFKEEQIESLFLSSGLQFSFKTNQFSFKGKRCSINNWHIDNMKQSRKGGLCFVDGETKGVYGVVIVGSEIVLLRPSGGIDFCVASPYSMAELDLGCT